MNSRLPSVVPMNWPLMMGARTMPLPLMREPLRRACQPSTPIPPSTVCSHFSRAPPPTNNDGRRPPRTRPEWTLTAQIAWMNTPPPTSGILLGCQRQTCLWRKRVVSFFTNRGMSNCLVRCDNFFVASLDTHMVPSVAPRQGSIPSQQDYPPRGRLESRNTFPASNPHYANSGVPPQFFRNHAATLPGEWPYTDHTPSSEIPAPASADVARTKVFVCPLFSCGRMYKRMEHLKRHVRSHTMERPFQCHRCNKKFSRQDNLNQHLRIHMRMDAEGVTGTTANYMAAIGEDESAHADVEDLDELEGVDGGLLNIGVCEVEVEGAIHEVEGDEEGLITTNSTNYVAEPNGIHPMVGQDAYYPGSAPDQHFPMSSSPEPSSFSDPSSAVNWMTRASPSPAFSTQSMPSPSQHALHMSQSGSYNQAGEYMSSVSAPSHKATFDHGAIYPAQLLPSTGPGPIRRHRSVTPSLARYGESIRRPYSAAMTDQPTHGNRSYHPYAVSSHSGSAQSSPGTYNVPLDYNTPMTGSLPSHLSRSSSTSRPGSSHLPDQMNQMLHLNSMDSGYTGESTGTGGSYGGMYRSDSPASFTSGTYSHHGGSTDGHQMYQVQPQYAGHVDQYYPPHAQTVPL